MLTETPDGDGLYRHIEKAVSKEKSGQLLMGARHARMSTSLSAHTGPSAKTLTASIDITVENNRRGGRTRL